MKWTKSPKVAMQRLAEVLGWSVSSSGRAWSITNLPCSEGLTYSAMSLLCFMTRIARASQDIGGSAMSKEYIRETIRFRPEHIYSGKDFRWFLKLPAMAATDEATIYANYFNPGEES